RRSDPAEVDLREGDDVGPKQVDGVVGDEQAEGAEGGRRFGHEDAADAELGGLRPRVDWAVAAVGDHRHVAGVGTVRRQHLANGVGHVGVDDALDAPRGVYDVELQGVGHVPLDRLAGGLDVEGHAPTREVFYREVPED